MSSRPRVFSGMQPTADSLHLGNYLGALTQWVAMQEDHDCVYCVVDLHAITMQHDPAELRRRPASPPPSFLPRASTHPAASCSCRATCPSTRNSRGCLSCITGYGEASRMTQFKDKSARQQSDRVTVGLFTYPILQAADILLYQANQVPVGEDQRQHIELTRDLAQRFNTRFGETFVVPEPHIVKATAKILDLQQPDKQMSKSLGGAGLSLPARRHEDEHQEDQVGGDRQRTRHRLRPRVQGGCLQLAHHPGDADLAQPTAEVASDFAGKGTAI